MSYSLICWTRPRARKRHRCIWCGEDIEKGETYYHERSRYEGELQNHHWHLECDEFAEREVFGHGDEEFDAYSNERPARRAAGEGE